MVNNITDVTHIGWYEVFEMNIIEFLNITCYIRDKNNWEKEQMEKWRRAH